MSDEDVDRRSIRIFLSYAYEDHLDATRVAQALNEAGLNVWFGQGHFKPGDNADNRIAEAIRSSDKLVVLLSPRSVASPWVQAELEQAMSARLDRRGIDIIPALLATCDVPDDLRSRGIVDLTQDNPTGLQELIERLRYSKAIDFRRLDDDSFNQLVADLLRRIGLAVESELRTRPDRGVDMVASYQHADPLGAEQLTVYLVESKFYPRERPSVSSIHRLLGYLDEAPGNVRGLLVTNAHLTSEARRFLEEDKPTMRLVSVLDGSALRRLLVQHPDLIERYFGQRWK